MTDLDNLIARIDLLKFDQEVLRNDIFDLAIEMYNEPKEIKHYAEMIIKTLSIYSKEELSESLTKEIDYQLSK